MKSRRKRKIGILARITPEQYETVTILFPNLKGKRKGKP